MSNYWCLPLKKKKTELQREEAEPHASVGACISKFTQQAGGRLHRGGVKAEGTIL